MNRFSIPLLLLFLAFLVPATGQNNLDEIKSDVRKVIDGKEYYIHTIRRGQTLYMISKAYGIDVNDVIRENPEVKDGIQAGQQIKIPTGKVVPSEKPVTPVKKGETPAAKPVVAPKTEPARPTPTVPLPCGMDKSSQKEVYHVALMLPMYLGDVANIDAVNPPDDALDTYRPLQFVQFYEGFRMAVDSLEKLGLSMKLYVYDVDKDTTKTRKVLRSPEMQDMDLIIGLLYHRNFQIVADFALKNKIPIVNPISEREELIKDNPMVIKVRAPERSQLPELAQFLNDSCRSDQILILKSSQYSDKSAADQLKNECLSLNMVTTIADNLSSAITMLAKDRRNRVIIFTENNGYALDALTKLNEIRADHPMEVIGMPRWDKMEKLDADYLVNLKTTMMTPWFIEEESGQYRIFSTKFFNRYKTLPDPLGCQGFDTGLFFLTALKTYGTGFPVCMNELKIKMIEAEYDFDRNEGDGWQNQHWDLYRYVTGYALEKVY